NGLYPQAARRRPAGRSRRARRARSHELRLPAARPPARSVCPHACVLDPSGDLARAQATSAELTTTLATSTQRQAAKRPSSGSSRERNLREQFRSRELVVRTQRQGREAAVFRIFARSESARADSDLAQSSAESTEVTPARLEARRPKQRKNADVEHETYGCRGD